MDEMDVRWIRKNGRSVSASGSNRGSRKKLSSRMIPAASSLERRSRFTVRLCLSCLVAVFIAMAGAGRACADPLTTGTWTGGGVSGSWSNATNWTNQPTTSGSWSLIFSGTSQTATTNDIGAITVDSLSFTNDGTAGKTATFTLSGSTLNLSAATISTTAASGLSSNSDVIGNRLSLSGANTVSLGGGHSLTISGDISGLGASLTKSGSGALFLTGSNSYTGTTTINSGNVRTGSGGTSSDSNNYALGTGDVVVNNGGMLSVRNSTSLSNNILISGTGATVGASGGAPLVGSFGAANQTAVVSGTVTLGGSTSISTWGSTGVTDSRLRLTGPIELG
ncbi:MAG: autotransporter-associated beta strand repeat-containing protein, partial [Planctomycetia bacterium]